MTTKSLPGRLAAIYRRRGRPARIVELPADLAQAEQVRQQARRDYPGETLIFTVEQSARADTRG